MTTIKEQSEVNDTTTTTTKSDTGDTKLTTTHPDFLKFYRDTILDDKAYTKVYTIQDISLVLRTRGGEESDQIIRKLDAIDKVGMNAVRLMNDCNLAFGLVKLGAKSYDQGTLDERLTIISHMPAPKKILLWDYMSHFDKYIDEMRKLLENF